MSTPGIAEKDLISDAQAKDVEARPRWSSRLFSLLVRNYQEITGLDLRSLAVYRIGLALILLVDLFIRFGDLEAHYTDQGLLPRDALPSEPRLSLHVFSGSYGFEVVLFALAALCALALLLGFRTRLATCLSWFLLLSLQGRNPIILQGGDVMLRLLLFWSMFLPLGARWSLDRHAAPSADEPPQLVSLATLALLLQICLLYWCSVLLKSAPCWRAEGTAVYYALSFDQLVTPLGHYLLSFPGLLRVLTFATLWLEAIGPLLLFCPFFTGPVRLVVVLVFVAFHLLGMNLCLELGPFPYVCAVAWLALLPDCFWDALARRWTARFRLLTEDDLQSDSPSLRESAGQLLRGLGERFLGILTPLLPAERTADKPQPPLARRDDLFLLSRLVLAAALGYVILWNIRTLDFARYSKFFPIQVNPIGFTLGLDQYWAMFAPEPARADGWYVIEGDLNNGTKVDLFQGGAPLTWQKPEPVAKTYPNERWRKLGTNLHQADYASYRVHYARYLARHWNARHKQDLQVNIVKIYFIAEWTQPNYVPPTIERLLLCEYHCTEADYPPR